jgi:hypothetical protein
LKVGSMRLRKSAPSMRNSDSRISKPERFIISVALLTHSLI